MRKLALLLFILLPIISLSQQEEYGDRKFINWRTGDTLQLSMQDSIIKILSSDSVNIEKLWGYPITSGRTTAASIYSVSNDTIFVDPVEGNVYDNSNFQGTPKQVTFPADTFTTPFDDVLYIYGDWNGGDPVMKSTTTKSIVNASNHIPIITVFRMNAHTLVQHWDYMGNGLAERLNLKDINANRFEHESGLTIDTLNDLNVQTTSGVIWQGGKKFELGAANSLTDTMYFYYYDGVSWQHTDTATINNTQYNDETGLVEGGNNQWLAQFFFLCVCEDPNLIMVLDNQEYDKLSDALEADLPNNLPDIATKFSVPVGRTVIETNEPTVDDIASYFEKDFISPGVTNHGDLNGLDDPSDHLWALQWADTTDMIATKYDIDTISTGGGGVTDHGELSGLGDDDHSQYLNLNGRGGQTISDNITLSGFMNLPEITEPSTPPSNTLRLYAYDNGGVTEFDIKLPSGNSFFQDWDKDVTDDFTTSDETDPVFSSHLASDITESDTIHWGDHFTGSDITGDETAFDGWDKDASDDFTTSDETDPVFTSHLAYDITASDTTHWGDHFTNTDETDPVYSGDPASSITASNSGEVITTTERNNLTDAYNERGSQIDGANLNWDGAELDVTGVVTNETDPVYNSEPASGIASGDISYWNNLDLQDATDNDNSTTNRIRVTGNGSQPSSGAGIELIYANDQGYIQPIDRGTSDYKTMNYRASSHDFLTGDLNIDNALSVGGNAYLNSSDFDGVTRHRSSLIRSVVIGYENDTSNTFYAGFDVVAGNFGIVSSITGVSNSPILFNADAPDGSMVLNDNGTLDLTGGTVNVTDGSINLYRRLNVKGESGVVNGSIWLDEHADWSGEVGADQYKIEAHAGYLYFASGGSGIARFRNSDNNNVIQFDANGTINNSGEIQSDGIGTNNFAGKISLDNTNFLNHITFNRTDEPFDLTQGVDNNLYISWENAPSYGQDSRWYIGPSGDIFHASGRVNILENFSVQGTGDSYVMGEFGIKTNNPQYGSLEVAAPQDGPSAGITMYNGGTYTTARSWIGPNGEWHMTRGSQASEGITLLSGPLVGINEINPRKFLHVTGSTHQIAFEDTDGSTDANLWYMGANADEFQLLSRQDNGDPDYTAFSVHHSDGGVRFFNNVEFSDDVGIGTDNPSPGTSQLKSVDQVLQIGDNSLNPEIRLAGPNSDTVSSKISFDNSSTGDGMSIIFNSESATSFGPDGLIFYNENNGGVNLKINRNNGFVGVQTAKPQTDFDVAGNMQISGTINGTDPDNWITGYTETQGLSDITAIDNTTADDIYAADFILNSDRRLKKDIKDFTRPLAALDLNPVQFKWRESEKFDAGFVAQDLLAKFPYLVKERPDGYYGISYSKITAVNNAAIHELYEQIETLKKENKKLKSKVRRMEQWLKENTSY